MLEVRVVSPARVVFEGRAVAVVAPAWDGSVGILRGHAPMITLLGTGRLTVDLMGGGSDSMYVAGGALRVADDRVTVLTEYAGEQPPDRPAEAPHPGDLGRETTAGASAADPLV